MDGFRRIETEGTVPIYGPEAVESDAPAWATKLFIKLSAFRLSP